jgi:hypothetical protein
LANSLTRPEVQEALGKLEQAFGGRQSLIDTLVIAPSTAQLQYVVGLIADPRNEKRTLGDICEEGGITPDQLFAAYRSGKAAKAQALAFDRIYDPVPDVAADLMRRALQHAALCTTCNGKGTLKEKQVIKGTTTDEIRYATTECYVCDGTGKIQKDPDLKTQELALTIAGMVPKAGGVNVGVNVDARQQLAPSASFSDVTKALAKMLAPPRVIDVDPV